MQKGYVTNSQMIKLMALFMFGSSIILGGGANLAQDSFLSSLVAAVIFVPIMLIYGRIIKLYPEKDLYEIMDLIFGKILSKIMIILFLWYCIHLGSLVLKNFSTFITTVQLNDTPEIVVGLCMTLTTILIARSGLSNLGKWASISLPAVVIVMILTFILSFKHFDFNNLVPIMVHSPNEILQGSIQTYSFPFAETVLFLALASSIKKEDNPYKIYAYALIIIVLSFFIVIFRNLMVLGQNTILRELYPSYSTLRIIRITNTLTRFESTIALNFIIGGLGKIIVCILASAKGIAKLMNTKDYKSVVVPAALMIMALSAIVYESEVQMFAFNKIYAIYAIPFQVVIPLVVWITAEIKQRKKMKKEAADTPAG